MPASVATSCSSASVPNIVASGSFVNETNSLSATTIFTPSENGLYRISIYGEGEDSESEPHVSAQLTYSDDFNSDYPVDFNLNTPISLAYVARLTASNPVQLSATINSGSPTYDLYYTIEQLQ